MKKICRYNRCRGTQIRKPFYFHNKTQKGLVPRSNLRCELRTKRLRRIITQKKETTLTLLGSIKTSLGVYVNFSIRRSSSKEENALKLHTVRSVLLLVSLRTSRFVDDDDEPQKSNRRSEGRRKIETR